MKFNLNPLSKFFSNLHRKPRSEPAALAVVKPSTKTTNPPAPKPATSTTAITQLPAQPPAAPTKTLLPGPKAPELLDSVVSFLRQHLVCEEAQLNVLALWIAHTWSFQNSPTAVYLEIRSPESQSGKSTCLMLLAMLSAAPWIAMGADPRTVVSRLLTKSRQVTSDTLVNLPTPTTIFLDNHQHTLGRSERQGLLAMLCSGNSVVNRFAAGDAEYWLFGPKAFAGNGPLPHSLAEHCLPLTFHRKKPSEVVARLNARVRERAAVLASQLQRWGHECSPAVAQAAARTPANIPTNLILPEVNNSEPLLHIADVIGGPWPERVRSALKAVYSDNATSLQLTALCDVRACFFRKEFPDYLLTRDILDVLRTQEDRPWSNWPRDSGGRLGALLRPLGVTSRNLDFPSGKRLKGYRLDELKEVWDRYLPPLPYNSIKDVPTLPPLKHNGF
jgi:hypothetical protein